MTEYQVGDIVRCIKGMFEGTLYEVIEILENEFLSLKGECECVILHNDEVELEQSFEDISYRLSPKSIIYSALQELEEFKDYDFEQLVEKSEFISNYLVQYMYEKNFGIIQDAGILNFVEFEKTEE